ncbi:uncharacterized protein LOC126888188 [Diabrotica virgifera virgifera]|uniref:Uncharacterized protein LOC114342508 n=1 Tax=Diabrotica virgifera virgifera TaxID=50390 RepID=A0A6P7GH23_DIAVI|nr:uncharacterized protein LOC126888188 [Diabrotica virgifera virgifera]
MKGAAVLALALFVAASIADVDILEVNVISSNVPNIDYTVTARETLLETYQLYPTNQTKRLTAFSLLFNETHPTYNGWKVSQNCSGFFNPTEHYWVTLNVTSSDGNLIIKIFD